jgi:hypothetical protein
VDSYDILALNTATFIAQRDVSSWAELYPLAAGVFRAHMRLTPADPIIQYEWSTENGRILYSESPARGSIAFTIQPVAASMIQIGTAVVTFVDSGASGLEVNIGADLPATLAALAEMLSASDDPQIGLCAYSVAGLVFNVRATALGVEGNRIALSTTVVGAKAEPMAGGAAAITLMAPLSETVTFNGVYAYDCRWEFQGMQFIPLFGGRLTFEQGVTREPSDSKVTADTIPSASFAATQPSLINALVHG